MEVEVGLDFGGGLVVGMLASEPRGPGFDVEYKLDPIVLIRLASVHSER